MARAAFKILPKNPNARGACLCSTSKVQDCKPPYLVFTHTEMMDARNDHPVLSMACACAGVEKAGRTAQGRGQLPAAPEPVEVEVPRAPTDDEILAVIRSASPVAASEQS